MKIHITFYKNILNISNRYNAHKCYLLIEPLLNLLTAFFVEKTRFLSMLFFKFKFGMRVYKGKIEARNKSISLYTFLKISPRKINISKKTKLGPRELNEVNDMNVKKNTTQFNQYFEIHYKKVKKWKKIKVLRIILYWSML